MDINQLFSIRRVILCLAPGGNADYFPNRMPHRKLLISTASPLTSP
jgi:hypothetical protein